MSLSEKDLAVGVKLDEGKPRYDLVSALALHEVTKVATYGARKYDNNNWRKGMAWGRLFGAAMRHLWSFWRGEVTDPESGLPHLAHAAWNVMALLEYSMLGTGTDDRWLKSR